MEIKGTGIGLGVAVGSVVRMADRLPEPVDRASHLDPEREAERAKASLSVVAEELNRRGRQAGGAAQDVLEAQAMMAEDPTLIDDVVKRLADGKTAERAVFEAFAAFRDMLLGMGGYMGERAAFPWTRAGAAGSSRRSCDARGPSRKRSGRSRPPSFCLVKRVPPTYRACSPRRPP